jgi:putative PIN family toxin of toxin-antitoxin system
MATEMEDNLIRVTVDTNVIISALLFGENSKKVIESIFKNKIRAYTSPQLVSELVDKLIMKFNFSREMILKLETQIATNFIIVYPTVLINKARDVDDNRVLEVAVESGSKIIVTGDKDLLTLEKYNDIEIISPKEFVDLYL